MTSSPRTAPHNQTGLGQKMYLLTYSTDTTREAIISYVSRTYDVDASVSFGNVEVLKDKPLGKLVVIFSGEEENIERRLSICRTPA